MPAPLNPSRFHWVWTGLAVAIAVAWLWINFCRFPFSSWNDIRLVPVFMAAAGESVYTLPGEGVLTTWMYGPIPLWLWSPALLGSSAVSAILIADFVNLLITVVAIALTCAYWPEKGISRTTRWLAFAATIAVWPDHAFRFLQADNLAVALGLFAHLLLVTSSPKNANRRGWIVAAATAIALGCKQTSMGILIAQVIWLACEYDRKTALIHLARTLVLGGILAGIAIWQFGFEALWFGVVSIAAHLPWVEQQWERLHSLGPILAVQWGVPILAMIIIGKPLFNTSHSLRLPFIAWVCSLPLGIIGLFTIGGSTNNLQGFHLIAAPLLLVALTAISKRTRNFYRPLTSAFVIVILCLRVQHAELTPVRPALFKIKEAIAIQAHFPEQVWLPWSPLVSYYAEDKFYHSEDGLYVRFITGNPVSLKQAMTHLPPRFRAMAFPGKDMQWGVARNLAKPNQRQWELGEWLIIEWPED
jgi:hypothetical protein